MRCKLCSERRKTVGAQGAGDLRLDAGKRLEDRWVGLRGDFSILVVIGDGPIAGCEGEVIDQSSIFIVRVLSGEAVKSVEMGGASGDGVQDSAAEERARRECLHVEAGDDAKVVGTAFEGFEEIGRRCVDVKDLAVGEDELVVDDVVADETCPAGEKGDAATSDETSDTDGGDTTTRDGKILGVETAVDARPSECEQSIQLLQSCTEGFKIEKIRAPTCCPAQS